MKYAASENKEDVFDELLDQFAQAAEVIFIFKINNENEFYSFFHRSKRFTFVGPTPSAPSTLLDWSPTKTARKPLMTTLQLIVKN